MLSTAAVRAPRLARVPGRCCIVKARGLHDAGRKAGLVFLGTPNVAADLLDSLLGASKASDAIFEVARAFLFAAGGIVHGLLQVVGVVTQPPSIKGRGRKLLPSPVAQRAVDKGFPVELIFSPEKAGEEMFLDQLRSLRPDLCVTAAYGNILPQRFLNIPKHGLKVELSFATNRVHSHASGTVNIHPSLLPLYRGAAPVQRAIQDGATLTGVTLAYTVRALDSGPIVASESTVVDSDIKAPDLQSHLFEQGTQLLLRELPHLLDGNAKERAVEQDHSKATLAPKIDVDEAWLCFNEPAQVVHNKVRAFAEWPGTKSLFEQYVEGQPSETIELKIVTTKLNKESHPVAAANRHQVVLKRNALLVECGNSTWLEILEVQPQGKKVMSGRDFWNGLQGKQLRKVVKLVATN